MINIQRNIIQIDGRDILYYQAGHGEPLVVIHGGGGDARTWLDNISELGEKFTVYAPDLPGFGGSEPLEGNYFIPELSEFIDKFATSLGLEEFHVMGHSLGGGVALDYALRSPHKIKKLVLISSLCLGSEIAFWIRLLSIPALIKYTSSLFLAVSRGIKWLLKYLNPAELIITMTPASLAIGSNITTFKQQTHILENRLSEVRMPTLLVWGGKDPVVPVSQAYKAATAIPDCQVKVFRKSGHNVHRQELQRFSDIITKFLG